MIPILKIIGIAILCLLAAAILVMLLVLFLPIRYRAEGKYDAGGAYIEGKVRWFFGLASVDIKYWNGQPLLAKARFLFITIFDLQNGGGKGIRLKRRKRGKDLADEPEFSAEIQAANISYGDNHSCGGEDDLGKADVKEADSIRESGKIADDAEKAGFFKKVKKFFKKLARFIYNIKFTFEKICGTIVKVRDNARYYWELFHEESTKQALASCKKQLAKIWKNSAPRKYEARLHLGFDDPSVMGDVLALWGMLYPLHLGRIDIIPEFDRKIIEGSFKLRGRTSVYVFLWALWIFMTDKNIKQLRSKLGI